MKVWVVYVEYGEEILAICESEALAIREVTTSQKLHEKTSHTAGNECLGNYSCMQEFETRSE